MLCFCLHRVEVCLIWISMHMNNGMKIYSYMFIEGHTFAHAFQCERISYPQNHRSVQQDSCIIYLANPIVLAHTIAFKRFSLRKWTRNFLYKSILCMFENFVLLSKWKQKNQLAHERKFQRTGARTFRHMSMHAFNNSKRFVLFMQQLKSNNNDAKYSNKNLIFHDYAFFDAFS